MSFGVKQISIVEDFALETHFSDGLVGEIKFAPSFFVGAYEPFKEKARFKEVYVVDGSIAFPGGPKLPSETLYQEVKNNFRWVIV